MTHRVLLLGAGKIGRMIARFLQATGHPPRILPLAQSGMADEAAAAGA